MKSTDENEDQFVSRFRVALDACSAQQNSVISLHNWVKGTGSVNQEETSFIRNKEDLMSISSRPDNTLSYFQALVVRAGARLGQMCYKVRAGPTNAIGCKLGAASRHKLTELELQAILP